MVENNNHSSLQEQKRWKMYKELKPAMQMKIESKKLDRFGIGCGIVVGAIVATPILCKLMVWGAEHNDNFWNSIHTIEDLINK